MSIEYQRFFDTRGFRIAVIAAAAVVVLVGAAYWFGTGLQADTSASVAPSPLGSSIANVREVQSVAPSPLGSSLTAVRGIDSATAAKAASLAALAKSRSDFYAELNASAAGAARATSLAGLAKSRSDFYAELNASAAAARGALMAELAERWAPFYTGLDKALKDAGARP